SRLRSASRDQSVRGADQSSSLPTFPVVEIDSRTLRRIPMRKISLTLLVGGLLAASALVAGPAMAGADDEASRDWSQPRQYNSGYAYTHTTTGYPTTYYTAPGPVVTTSPVIATAPVVAPAPGTTVTTYNNGVASYTTTYGAVVTSPSVSYVAPAPST